MRKHSPCMSSDMGASGGAEIGLPLMAAASPMISPKRLAIRRGLSLGDDSGFGGSPGAGELGRRTRKDVVQGGDEVNLEVLLGVLGVRNSGPEDVNGLSEIHRRGEKELLGEEPLFRQRAAGSTGGGGSQGSCSVFSAEAPETRPVPVTRRQGSGTGGALRPFSRQLLQERSPVALRALL